MLMQDTKRTANIVGKFMLINTPVGCSRLMALFKAMKMVRGASYSISAIAVSSTASIAQRIRPLKASSVVSTEWSILSSTFYLKYHPVKLGRRFTSSHLAQEAKR